MPAKRGVSGGYLYHVNRSLGIPQYLLELYELPCLRIRPIPPCWARLTHSVPYNIQSVTVDAGQALLVLGGIFQLFVH
jgi:hypothetical protein